MTQETVQPERRQKLRLSFKNHNVEIPYSRQKEFLNAHDHGEASWRVQKIAAEFIKGYDFLEKFDRSVTFFGSARRNFDDAVYHEATQLAGFCAKMGFAVFTGGGPGIMEAANKGAREAGGLSIGININLPQQNRHLIERRNPYIDRGESFDFFFSRKVILSYASQFYIFFPGGFGTMDELFEMLTLIQTKKTSPVPVLLVGKDFWDPLVAWIKETMLEKGGAISPEDLDLFHVVADAEEAMTFITACLARDERQ